MKPQDYRHGRIKKEVLKEHKRILVADDDEDNRDLLCAFLVRNGYEAVPAASGLLVLDALARHTPDLILLDMTMPGLNGIDLLKQIRTQFSPSELPVIAVIGQNESASVVEALSLGANDHLCKPIEFAAARTRIKSQLQPKSLDTPRLTKTDKRPAVVEAISGGSVGLESDNGSRHFQ